MHIEEKIIGSHKKIFFLIAFIYLLCGIFFSIYLGISHDEYHEQLNWIINLNSIKDFFLNLDSEAFEQLNNYNDKYYGIGFQYISQPFQIFFSNLISSFLSVSDYGSQLLAKHPVIFIYFFISSIFFFKLIFLITKNYYFSFFATSFYSLNPYLLGHAMMNSKDIPFMSIWLILTYYSFSVIKSFLDLNINKKLFYLFCFLNAYLFSIRSLGILIFFQYLIIFIVFFEKNKNYVFLNILRKNIKNLITGIFVYFFSIYILSPYMWQNPLEFFNSILWFSKYYNNVCTLTLGECVFSSEISIDYIPVWLFFKLPVLCLLGLVVIPFFDKKIFFSSTEVYLHTLILTPILIIVLFFLLNVRLYDEIRQVLFVIPFLYLSSLSSLYFIFRKKVLYLLTPFLFLFILENIFMYPYNYIWFNSTAKFTDIQKNFELDYWGVGNRKISQIIKKNYETRNLSKTQCVYGNAYLKEFLSSDFKCFDSYSSFESSKKRPVLVYQDTRNIKKGSPDNCSLIHQEEMNLIFYRKEAVISNLWYCK